ncbi:MAG: SUMF1/EgtB/PvdO family nonheme iron enzyme, partial [Planctomycetota bacterium]|nr:SUMF1/EgtB/PvdO family nonheme iron enzyme [Planctomycetota bacterium]
REQFWIGLSDSQKKGEFKWVNGSPLTFKKWDKDQPDGGTTQQGVTIRQRGFWGDDNIEHGFICEWPEEAELRKDGRTKTLLAPPLDGFESPRGELDSFGNRVLRGKDAETGLPLEIRHQKTGMHFIFVPAGEFQMGSPDHFGFIEEFLEHPRHKVKLSSPFYIGKYEVTQADWLKLSPANPSKFKGERKPVADITFFDASNYAQKANDAADGTLQFSLPTEAQWERACRSGTETYYYFGDEGKETRLNRHAVHKGNSGNKPGDTGTKKPNPWGIYDMYGSVSEWCLDWAENYSEDVALDPRGPKKGQKKIHRGGHWFNEPAKIRSSRRQAYKTSTKQSSLGFRLVANLPRETFERIRRPTSFERVPRELRPTIREYRGHAYLLVPEWGRWQGGLKKSERMGGHLITFADRAENDFAYQLARGYGRMWIGLRRKDNGFEWITGEQPAFYNWGRGQPDNWGKNENVVETHGELDHRFGAPGTWNDAGNDARQHVFITEWDEIPRDWAKLHERIKEWKGHYYLFVPEAMDWSSSVAKCRALGGYIVNIGDAEERDFVARLCGKMSAWTGPADQRQTLEGERYFVCEWDQKPE